MRLALTALLLAASTGAAAADPPQADAPLRVRYLGSSGLSLRRGTDHIVTAPFFSNPGKWRVVFGSIAPDPSRFPADVAELMHDVAAVLVGHSHHDHLMDVPAVARWLPEHAVVYGNVATVHILAAADAFPLRAVAVEAQAGDATGAGEWIAIEAAHARFMPLRSGHAPHLAGIRVYDGDYDEDLEALPTRAKDWRMGQPLSFVIDFLDSDPQKPPRFRIFYQDSATNEPEGFPPPLADGKPFDLAVLCVASFGQVENHPEKILERVNPRAVLLTHWEDFSRPQSEPVRSVPGTNIERFMERFAAALPEGRPYWMPKPGETVVLEPAP